MLRSFAEIAKFLWEHRYFLLSEESSVGYFFVSTLHDYSKFIWSRTSKWKSISNSMKRKIADPPEIHVHVHVHVLAIIAILDIFLFNGGLTMRNDLGDTYRKSIEMFVYITQDVLEDIPSAERAAILQRCSDFILKILKPILLNTNSAINKASGNSVFTDGFLLESRKDWLTFGSHVLLMLLERCLVAEEANVTATSITNFLMEYCFPHLNAFSVLHHLAGNDQDLISFCCTFLKIQLRLEHILTTRDSSSGAVEIPSFHGKLLKVMEERGFSAMLLFLAFIEVALSFDASVLLDLLCNSETAALEYLLRVTKFLLMENKSSLSIKIAHLNKLHGSFLDEESSLMSNDFVANDCASKIENSKTVIRLISEYKIDSVHIDEAIDSSRVSNYEWERSQKCKNPSNLLSRTYVFEDWIQFFCNLIDKLTVKVHRSLPFDPSLLRARMHKVIQSLH